MNYEFERGIMYAIAQLIKRNSVESLASAAELWHESGLEHLRVNGRRILDIADPRDRRVITDWLFINGQGSGL